MINDRIESENNRDFEIGRGLLSPGHYVSDYLKALENLKQFDGTYDAFWLSHNELVCPLEVLDGRVGNIYYVDENAR